jgi:hypothetical protein
LGIVVLIVLAAVWAAFLLPPVLRARSEHRPSGSISDFRRQLYVLSRTSPIVVATGPGMGERRAPAGSARVVPIRPGLAPPVPVMSPGLRLGRRRSTVKRRRDIFVGLLVAMAGSLVLGVAPPLRLLWTIHILIDVAFVAYVGALVYLRSQEAETQRVQFIPGAEPALLLRRSAN